MYFLGDLGYLNGNEDLKKTRAHSLPGVCQPVKTSTTTGTQCRRLPLPQKTRKMMGEYPQLTEHKNLSNTQSPSGGAKEKSDGSNPWGAFKGSQVVVGLAGVHLAEP